MRKKFILCATVMSLLIFNTVRPQAGESKFKKVVINQNEKIVVPLVPSFRINDLRYTDANMNRKLDAEEAGSIGFCLKNSGNTVLNEILIDLNISDSIKGISFVKTHRVNQINPGDSIELNIPLATNDKLGDGFAKFDLLIKDTGSDSTKTIRLNIPTSSPIPIPVFAWIYPDSVQATSKLGVIEIIGNVKTKSDINWLKVYVNGQIPDDKKAFNVLATENPTIYRVEKTISLNEGDNDVRIEIKNDQGVATSESRVINYYVPRLDQKYVEKRLALVVGNADYLNANPLQNPINDAKAISQALKEVGFTVLLFINADLKTMKKAMDEFGEKLKNYTVGLFYYAGHGMQVKGNNYLIPVDASLKVEQDVDYDCVDAGRLLGKMESATTSTNIVILDACRDNPFSRSWGSRSTSQESTGLAFMNAPSGTIIAYATSPGKTASDGTGKNGLYTEALLQFIKVPSLPIEDFFKSVRVTVEKKSKGKQTPWESTSLKGNFYFTIK